MLLSLLLVVVLSNCLPTQAQITAVHSCLKVDSLVAETTIRVEISGSASVIYAKGFRYTAGCFDTIPPYLIEFNVDNTPNNCGVQTISPDTYTIDVIGQKGLHTSDATNDRMFTITCNYSAPLGAQIIQSALGVTVNNPIVSTGISIASLEQVYLNLISNAEDSYTTNVLSSCNFGQLVKLQVKLDTRKQLPARGVRVEKCFATTNAASIGNPTLFEEILTNRCPPQNGRLPGGFTGLPINSTTNSSVAISSPFQCFAFTGQTGVKTLHFICVVSFCRSGESGCLGAQCSSSSDKRKKRETKEYKRVSTTVNVNITTFNSATHYLDQGTSNNTECFKSAWFYVVMTVIAVIMLLSIILTTYLCRRVNKYSRIANGSCTCKQSTNSSRYNRISRRTITTQLDSCSNRQLSNYSVFSNKYAGISSHSAENSEKDDKTLCMVSFSVEDGTVDCRAIT